MPQNALGPRPGGNTPVYDITAAQTVKASPGTLYRISVTTAGSAAGAAYDSASTGGVAAGNLICEIPNAVGVTYVEWPCENGITIVPGTGQVVSVSIA